MFERKKKELVERLINNQDDKFYYSLEKMFEYMGKGTCLGISSHGNIEDIKKIENEEKVEVECKRSCIIEGMVHKELPIIAVQWHPELMHADPVSGTLDQDRMFVYFASMYE